MKIIHFIAKILLSLILLSPIGGVLGMFPAPTRDLYNTDVAFEFINFLGTNAVYINYLMMIVYLFVLIALWTRREVLAGLLLLPLTVNILAFHIFLDGGLFTSGSIMAIVLAVLNMYFLYRNRVFLRTICHYKSA